MGTAVASLTLGFVSLSPPLWVSLLSSLTCRGSALCRRDPLSRILGHTHSGRANHVEVVWNHVQLFRKCLKDIDGRFRKDWIVSRSSGDLALGLLEEFTFDNNILVDRFLRSSADFFARLTELHPNRSWCGVVSEGQILRFIGNPVPSRCGAEALPCRSGQFRSTSQPFL